MNIEGFAKLDAMGEVSRDPKVFANGNGCRFSLKCGKVFLQFKAWDSMAKICSSLCPGEIVTISTKPKASKRTDESGNVKWETDWVVVRIDRSASGDRSADFAKYGPDITPKVQPPKPSEPLPADPMEVADDIPF